MTTSTAHKETAQVMLLSDKEKHLIEIIRSTECSHIEIYVQDCIPLKVEKIRESIKL